MGVFDALLDSAVQAARDEACGIMLSTAQEREYNPGQEYLMWEYVYPAMEEAVQGGERMDGIAGAGYDSHYAAEQALSETIEDMTSAAEFILEVLDVADVLDILDWV